MLRDARQVLNRIDRTFAAELARCELRKSKPLDLPSIIKPAMASPVRDAAASSPVRDAVTSSPIRVSEPSPPGKGQVASGDSPWRGEGEQRRTSPSLPAPPPEQHPTADDLLIVDIEASPAAVVPGRNFRRLFTSLEAAAAPRARRG